MRIIDLTVPLFEGMGYGNVYPQERPFEIEPIGGMMQLFTVYCELATRRLMYSYDVTMRDGPRIHQMEANVVLQDTAIVDVGPKGPLEKVTPEDIEKGMAKADFREGDGVIFRTGWGDGERYRKMGDDYERLSPNFGREDTFEKIAEIMIAKKSKLFCYDTANCMNMQESFKDWLERKPRARPWPSPEAKAWLVKAALAPPPKVPEKGIMLGRLARLKISFLGALVNCGEIKKKRVKLIALPLKVEGVSFAPCNVIAIEE